MALKPENDEDIGWCVCGAAWFELAPYDELEADADVGAAVCITAEGDITGYAGRLICIECGVDWQPRLPPVLQVINGGLDDG